MNQPDPVQLFLKVSLSDDATFANFYYHSPAQQQAVDALAAFAQRDPRLGTNLAIWGASGAGLTHLLQAVTHAAFKTGCHVQYLPLRDLIDQAPERVCDGLEQVEMLCLDDLDAISGQPAWEQALFHLFNRRRDTGKHLIMAAHTPIAALDVGLADLHSRLLGSLIYHIDSLDDAGKEQALIRRANARGLDLPGETARFILTRAPRTTHDLFQLLNRLDNASLQHQRKLTVPFVRGLLGEV
jgi:DnaA family protein